MNKKINTRYQKILDLLYKDNTIGIDIMATKCKVSKMTIRRDLLAMENLQLIYRVHGGARIKKSAMHDIAFKNRSNYNINIKKKLATRGIELIKEGQTIYLDSGTTNYELAKLIIDKFENLNIITNDVNIAKCMCASNNVIFLLGGIMDTKSETIAGNIALEVLKQFCLDVIFFSSSTITNDYFIGTSSEAKHVIKDYLLSLNAKKYLMIDKSKLQTRAIFKVCNIIDLDVIVTDIDLTNHKNILEHIEYINVK